MSAWRPALIGILIVVPVLLLAGVGGWTLWESGRLLYYWWPLPICWGVAWYLLRRWKRALSPANLPEFGSRTHWTPQDHQAAELVAAKQRTVDDLSAAQLTNPRVYTETALDLAERIACHYHPRARDPFGSLTVIEILAAVRLAAEDLEEWFQKYVPASHLMTVSQWKSLRKVPGWWKAASHVGWGVSVLLNPANIGRFVLSKMAVDPLSGKLSDSLLSAFYVMYVRQVGFYLIEMNSGRLRGGAEPYRSASRRFGAARPAAESVPSETPQPAPQAAEVTIAVIGQVKAGKSSLINALVGGQQAAVDVLPQTNRVERYRLQLPDQPERLTLLDTPGYGEAAASAERDATLAACRQADLVLLVMDARSPARDDDLKLVQQLAAWYDDQRRLRPAPLIGVLTHVDGLSPMMEWSPPYDWQQPSRPKEQSIRDAVAYNAELFGERLAAIAPVCTDVERNRVWGVAEWLEPIMILQFGEARACGLVRALHSEIGQGKVRQVFSQLTGAGRQLIKAYRGGRDGEAR